MIFYFFFFLIIIYYAKTIRSKPYARETRGAVSGQQSHSVQFADLCVQGSALRGTVARAAVHRRFWVMRAARAPRDNRRVSPPGRSTISGPAAGVCVIAARPSTRPPVRQPAAAVHLAPRRDVIAGRHSRRPFAFIRTRPISVPLPPIITRVLVAAFHYIYIYIYALPSAAPVVVPPPTPIISPLSYLYMRPLPLPISVSLSLIHSAAVCTATVR